MLLVKRSCFQILQEAEINSSLSSSLFHRLTIIIPPANEVYKGYIVFVFSVTISVCLCVNFFSVKDFSETAAPRILKFSTNIGYDLLYRVRENQHFVLIIPFIGLCLPFSQMKIFVTHFSAPMRARDFKFCIHQRRVGLLCKRNPWRTFSCFSYSNVMHWEICVKDFSGSRILKFGKKNCFIVKDRISILIFIFAFIFHFFFPSNNKNVLRICLRSYES